MPWLLPLLLSAVVLTQPPAVDLSAIDANPNVAGDQAFIFLADPAHCSPPGSSLAAFLALSPIPPRR